jgi:hypothetical protein
MSGAVTLGSASFLNGIGTDTQITYTDGHYATIGNVIADLKYLGITQVRDGISNGAGGSAPVSSYISVAQAGIEFTFLISNNDQDNADILEQVALFGQVEAAVPGSIIAIEGPNEINNSPVTFDGSTGLAGAVSLQAALFDDVAADPTLAGVAVDYFTGYDAFSASGAGMIGLGPLIPAPGLADYDNQHPYPQDGQPPALAVSRANAFPNAASATAPAVYTETGYSTMQVSDYTQAVYTLDLLFDTAQQGISRTYLYQLLDAYAPGSPQGDSGFGLFDDTGAPKLAAVALHDLNAIIGSIGTGGAISSAISFSLAGLPATGDALELTGSPEDVIALWAEPAIWDAATGTNLTAPTEYVTLTLPETYATLALFDPLSGTSAIEFFADTDRVTIALTDHPVLLKIPDGAPCFCIGTRILTAGGTLRRVEELQTGDQVKLFSGAAATVVWVGRRTLDLRGHPRPEAVQPVLFAAGALGPGLPCRDLIVSPDHAIYLDGHLIPAKALLNGFSIRQLKRKKITYYHVELADHAVLFAEGTPVESYLETGNRAAFENAGSGMLLHPLVAQALREEKGCAPFAESGPVVEAVRQSILELAGIQTTTDPGLQIRYENGAAIIASRAAIPGEISADPRDRRRLGVKIAELRIGGTVVSLSHPSLVEGWHGLEPDGRWTNGRAVIPELLLDSFGSVEISLAATLRYPATASRASHPDFTLQKTGHLA